MSRLQELLEEIRDLEERMADQISREAEQFGYTIKRGRISFENGIVKQHKALAKHIKQYLSECSFLGLVVAPVVYCLIVPVLIFDIFIWFYQMICFPVYGLPKVKRSDYIVFDRHQLKYLNIIERFNCVYCSYANGFIAFVQEVAARSEQYWCPIKHAKRLKGTHARYHDFIAYGDIEGYKIKLDNLRNELTNR